MNWNRISVALPTIVALTLTNPAPVSAGAYEEGLAAYEQSQYQRALDLWFPLALAGHCRAQFGLGELANLRSLRKSSVSIELDDVTAAKLSNSLSAAEYWYTEAAEQGHVGAMRELGGFYTSMLHHYIFPEAVVNMDFWHRRAAEGGDLWSMRMLIDKYYDTDPFETLKWAFLLKRGGDPRRKTDELITKLSSRLTEDDVLNAQIFALHWQPDRHPPTPGGPCE